MTKPTRCTNAADQLIKERKAFERKMRPKTVLAEKIKRKEEREERVTAICGSEPVCIEALI